MAVYPRWRGEHHGSRIFGSGCHGLSPLARGTHFCQTFVCYLSRFIPAGAGNTRDRVARIAVPAGLSPLARGTLSITQNRPPALRFIPAGAGNTAEDLPTPPLGQVYPRWRGEHMAIDIFRPAFCGLSPLARGTRSVSTFSPAARRFIPAGAGNTRRGRSRCNRRSVYPRWRGEHYLHSTWRARRCGLSPLARGTLRHHLLSTKCRRFIPASAGNTPVPAPTNRGEAVYPRWRGEHLTRYRCQQTATGLSPLARGTLQ